jgi:hypothetical protein
LQEDRRSTHSLQAWPQMATQRGVGAEQSQGGAYHEHSSLQDGRGECHRGYPGATVSGRVIVQDCKENGLRSADIPSTMGGIPGLVMDTIVTSVLEKPEQRHGMEEAMPFPRLSDVWNKVHWGE